MFCFVSNLRCSLDVLHNLLWTVQWLQQHLRQNQKEQHAKKNNNNNGISGSISGISGHEVLQKAPGAPCDCGAEAMLLEVMPALITHALLLCMSRVCVIVVEAIKHQCRMQQAVALCDATRRHALLPVAAHLAIEASYCKHSALTLYSMFVQYFSCIIDHSLNDTCTVYIYMYTYVCSTLIGTRR
jgi:hypothetical protein